MSKLGPIPKMVKPAEENKLVVVEMVVTTWPDGTEFSKEHLDHIRDCETPWTCAMHYLHPMVLLQGVFSGPSVPGGPPGLPLIDSITGTVTRVRVRNESEVLESADRGTGPPIMH